MSLLAVDGPAGATVHPIDLARHDEIILVQSFYLLGAQGNRRITPAEDVGVMAFGFGELTDYLNEGSSTITQFGNTLLLGAMITTEESPILLKAVAENSDITCRTDGCERMDRTLEAIVDVSLSVLGYLECFVVIVSAGFTFGHGITAPKVLVLSIRFNPMLAQQVPL